MSHPKQTTTKRMSPSDYDKAKSMWASGRFRLQDISEKFDVSITALTKRFKKDGIKKGQDSDKHQKAIDQAMENSLVSEAEDTAKLIRVRKENVLRVSEQLEKRALFVIAKATKEEMPLAAVHGDIKTLLDAQKLISNGYDIASRVLGIERLEDQDKPLPTLQIQEMTAEDIAEIRDAQNQQLADLIEGDFDQLNSEEIVIAEAEPDDDRYSPAPAPQGEEDMS